MTDLENRFNAAATSAKALAVQPGNDTLLKLYALFKQGTEGDVAGPKPGFFDFVGTAKYEAWIRLKGLGNDEAMRRYIDLVQKLGG